MVLLFSVYPSLLLFFSLEARASSFVPSDKGCKALCFLDTAFCFFNLLSVRLLHQTLAALPFVLLPFVLIISLLISFYIISTRLRLMFPQRDSFVLREE